MAFLVQPARVHRALYTDPALFDLEMTRVFAASWNYVAHESQIREPGEFVTTTVPVVRVCSGCQHGEPMASGRAVLQHRRGLPDDLGSTRRGAGCGGAARACGSSGHSHRVRASRVLDVDDDDRRIDHACSTAGPRSRPGLGRAAMGRGGGRRDRTAQPHPSLSRWRPGCRAVVPPFEHTLGPALRSVHRPRAQAASFWQIVPHGLVTGDALACAEFPLVRAR